LAAAQLLVVTGLWLWFHTHHPLGNLLTGDDVGKLLAWGRLTGLLAAFGILVQLLLVGRVKWIERAFGLDRLTRLHHAFGFALVLLLLLHPVLITAGHALQADVGYWAQAADFCRTWKGLLTAVIGLSLMVLASVFSLLVLIKRVRYEFWYATHLTLYAAFALVFLHQVVSGSDFTDHPAFRYYWYSLYAFVLANLLACRFVRPLLAFARHRFVVTDVLQEAGDVTSVMIGGRDLPAFKIEAGQFMIVRFLAKGFLWEAHPFSLSCYPDGRRLRLSIKRLGDFTRRIPELKTGTPVLIDGPHGVFTARNGASGNVLLIAGGIGITPLRALAEEFVAQGRDVTLIYGSRTRGTIVFRNELDDLATRSGGRLSVVHVLSDEPGWPGEKGRVDRERLARLVPDLAAREIYLCGPSAMVRGVRAALANLGLPSARIHGERFAL
jgi:predicted ferric reductase